jgi:signal transduction histidine kinase/CheY-like chemotaxis protein/HAMP domain-containing protein
MKLRNLNIHAQLNLCLGLILLLVAILGGLAWVQTDKLWGQTKGLYEHPFQVRQAVGELEVQILTLHQGMTDLCLAQRDPERETILQAMAVSDAAVRRLLGDVAALYLGPRDDVAKIEQAFARWQVIRDETLRLLREGKASEALERTRSGSVGDSQAQEVVAQVRLVRDFAKARGGQFYRDAEMQHGVLMRQLPVTIGVVLLLSLSGGGLLLRGIRTPLTELTEVTQQFSQGRLDVRSGYVSANEFGLLAGAFNAMAEAIQTQTRSSEDVAQLAEVMLREEEAHAFCRELLKGLLTHTRSQVGAVYFLNEAQSEFEHFESIGLGSEGRAAFSATMPEGELGVVLAMRQIQRITQIPQDSRFAFAAVSGRFLPREILTIPVLSGERVAAVISLASVHAYDAASLRLVTNIWRVLAARVNGVLAHHKIRDFSARLEQQNRELEAQRQELSVRAFELAQQNTELEMQKLQLDEANRLKSAFLSNMSHELRTPLNSVIALTGVLSRRLAKTLPAEEAGFLEVIERNGRNLLLLINDILDLSRIEAGRQDLSISRFTVHDWVGEIVEILQPLAQEKNLALTCTLGEDLPPIISDPDLCRHILQNLVGNALKFTGAGSVEIAARQVGDAIEVAVHDTGIGIATDMLEHIFDEFRQADDGTSRKYGGTGLGLAIAKKYALLLGGDITVASTPGQGSTFTLRLPLAAHVAGALPAADPGWARAGRGAATALTPPPGGGQRLLLVEDNAPAIIQLTDILHAQGYQVQVAHDGREALALIGQSVPDAMILDLMMPQVDGFQVLAALRSDVRTAQVPVLILTAKHVSKEDLSFLKGNHIHQLIQKGDINKQGLLAAVARMVAPPAAPPPRRRPTRPGKPLVLVVEDNLDNRRTTRALLDEHYQIVEAEDGQAAVELAQLHQPDLVLTDLSLPVMDGFAALAAIRQDALLRDIPVIAVTATAMQGSREEILARGFDGYLSKPIDHDALLRILRGFLG